MYALWAGPATSHYTTRIVTLLTSFCRRGPRHAGAAGGLCHDAGADRHWAASPHGRQLPDAIADGPAPKETWSAASRNVAGPSPSAVQYLQDKTEISRFPASRGGRKDVLPLERRRPETVAELEIYRPGGELNQSGPPSPTSRRPKWDGDGMRKAGSPHGIIDSKFGTVTLLRLVGGRGIMRVPTSGVLKRVQRAHFRISGLVIARGQSGRQSSGPPRAISLHAEPADRADGRKRF